MPASLEARRRNTLGLEVSWPVPRESSFRMAGVISFPLYFMNLFFLLSRSGAASGATGDFSHRCVPLLERQTDSPFSVWNCSCYPRTPSMNAGQRRITGRVFLCRPVVCLFSWGWINILLSAQGLFICSGAFASECFKRGISGCPFSRRSPPD